MPTLTELETRLEALKAQRASGIARVTYDGKTVEYRGDNEIAAAIRDIETEIGKAKGESPVRTIRFNTSKGY
jgi:hypothetical protein